MNNLPQKLVGESFPLTQWIDNVTVLFCLRSRASVSTKVNDGKCIIYELKCPMCETIYIVNTQQTYKKKMYSHLSNLLRPLKNRQKSDSFAAHLEQHFKSTIPRIDLRKYMRFKLINQINPIGAMKKITKPN